MPYKPKRPCGHPGCPNLTDKQYCPEHEAQHRRAYNKYERSPESKKAYDYQWRKLRALYISHHPICERCAKEGRIVPVEEVHHIIPVNQGGKNVWSNLMSLCKSCHTKIHRDEIGDR